MAYQDFWQCNTTERITANTNNTFTNNLLPYLDLSCSVVGTLVNLFLFLTIYVRCGRIDFVPTSALLCANICLSNLLECANGVVLFSTWRMPRNGSLLSRAAKSNLVTISGVEDTVHLTRVLFILSLYITRLVYLVKPAFFSTYRARLAPVTHLFLVAVWVVAVAVGVSRAWFRSRSRETSDTASAVVFGLLLVHESVGVAASIISLGTIVYLIRILVRHRPAFLPGEEEGSTSRISTSTGTAQRYTIMSKSLVMYKCVKKALRLLLVLYLIDLMFQSYMYVITILTMQLTISCTPLLFIQIRNYLGTAVIFVISYHITGVLYGVFLCLVLLSQPGTMRQTLRHMAGVAGDRVVTLYGHVRST